MDWKSEEVRFLFNEEFLRRLEYLNIIARRIFKGRLKGERKSKKTGSGIEFSDHRSYSPGDDIRYIDWNLYGRSERLLLKLFEEEEDLYIYLLIDISNSIGFGTPPKFIHGIMIAASLAYIGLNSLDRVGVIAFSDSIKKELPPSRGKKQIYPLIEFLSTLYPQGETDLKKVMTQFVTRYKHKGVLILISDLYDLNYGEAFDILRYNKFEIYIIHLFDPKELNPLYHGDITLLDSETNEKINITVTPSIRKEFKRRLEQFLNGIERYCKTKGLLYVRAPIDTPFEDNVIRLFRKVRILE